MSALLLVILLFARNVQNGFATSYIHRGANHDDLINVKNCKLYGANPDPVISNKCDCPDRSSFYSIPSTRKGRAYCYRGPGRLGEFCLFLES